MKSPGFTREAFEAAAGENVSADKWYKPEMRPVTIDGVGYFVKDFRHRFRPWSRTIGRILIWREAVVHRALDGLPGIPGFVGQLDGLSLVTERIEGTDVSHFKQGRLPEGFLDRLSELIGRMHARGVVHCDLRQRKNVLVGPGGEPFLIDFASGIRLRPGSLLFRFTRTFDESGVAKLKEKHAPDTLTDREKRMLNRDLFRPFRRWRRSRRDRRKAARKAARQAAKR